jgi:Uma2 family endonuclease
MATVSYRSKAKTPSEEIPPLESGDRLSRAEFERRYEAMPGLKKAELIEGVVHMPSPVSVDRHGEPQFELIIFLGLYKWATPGIRGADNATARLDLGNEPQPDVSLFIDPPRGGQARLSSDGFLEAAPEFVAEIASSSVSYDLHSKLEVYRRNRVREYLVWRVRDREIDWFILRRRKYVKLPLDEKGLYRSEIFPGLWLDPGALIRGDTTALQAALQRGLASPEHAAFVAKLAAKAKP